jgi:serine/threonine-protein kinase
LRGDYNLASLPSDAARTVAKGLQTYGMYLADGGNIYISATTDASASINNAILGALTPKDFELIDGGARVDAANQDCKHVPVTQ